MLINNTCPNSLVEFARRQANVVVHNLAWVTTYTANPQIFYVVPHFFFLRDLVYVVPHCFHDIILNQMSWFCVPKNKSKNEEEKKINGFILTVDVSDPSKDSCKDLKHLIVAWKLLTKYLLSRLFLVTCNYNII